MFRYVKRFFYTKDSVVINDKYEIDSDGVVWYWSDYVGQRFRDFPQYLFPLAEMYARDGKLTQE